VEAHPDANLVVVRPIVGGERELRVGRRRHRVICCGERDEEGVTFRVDDVPAVAAEHLAQ
jgi:hypothetical protein